MLFHLHHIEITDVNTLYHLRRLGVIKKPVYIIKK